MAPNIDAELLRQAAELWKQAEYPVAFSGAGISVASGIPDFRSPGGLWDIYDPARVATSQALVVNPRGVWEFLLDAGAILDRAQPNAAHEALARLEQAGRLKGIITQNIDNLHQRAGSREIVEYHGNFQRFYCQSCWQESPADRVQDKSKQSIPVYCEECGGLIRPDAVFFGESIPVRAQQKSAGLVDRADLMLIVGTSGEVAPANVLPRQVKFKGGSIIEINLGPTAYTDITDVRFDAPVESVLPQLAELVLDS
jgi:NAD-dependent deacetylase